jgi:ferric-dicitrate binding protein FerR (iron transport regulator)
VNAEPKNTDQHSAVTETDYERRPSDDPQAVQVENSGISAEESGRRRRWRNIALAVALGAFVVLIFVITLVKLGANVMNRPL